MSNVVLYARFSPRPRANECDSCDRQLEDLRAWAVENNHTVMGEFRDDDVSGAIDDDIKRPGIYDAIMHLKRGWILVVRDLSRLARKADAMVEYERRIKMRGARIRGVNDNCTLDTPQEVFMYRLLAAYAEFQREVTKEMTRARMRAHQKNGRPMGSKPPYGWAKVQHNKQMILQEVEFEQDRLAEMNGRVDNGESLLGVMKDFNSRRIFNRSGRPWTYCHFWKIRQRYKDGMNPNVEKFENPPTMDVGTEKVGTLLEDDKNDTSDI